MDYLEKGASMIQKITMESMQEKLLKNMRKNMFFAIFTSSYTFLQNIFLKLELSP